MNDPSAAARREFATLVVRQLTDAGFTAYWAGGCVRDDLLGLTPKDYDVATSATPDQVTDLFGTRRTLAVGRSFGVIVVLGRNKSQGQVEVATFRTDGSYTDGRRPDSVCFSSPEEDALRRDFTVNAMFFDPLQDRLIDFVGGEADLRKKSLRAVGDPVRRFEEDRLRMLRAVRFAATFDLLPDPETLEAVRRHHTAIQTVSAERIGHELRRMLAHHSRLRAVELLRETGLLVTALPGESTNTDSVPEAWNLLRVRLSTLKEPHFAPALLLTAEFRCAASADPDVLGPALRLSNEETSVLRFLQRHREPLRDADSLPPHVLKPVLADDRIPLLIDLIRADEAADEAAGAAALLQEKLVTIPREELDPPPLINGRDLIEAGIPGGPGMRELLQQIRNAQLDGLISDRRTAMKLAVELHRN